MQTLDKQKAAVIIDNGAKTTKAGFSGEEKPKFVFPTLSAQSKYPNNPDFEHSNLIFGQEALKRAQVLDLVTPLKDGAIQNFGAMEQIWRHIFHDKLKVEPERQPVLLTESPLNSMESRRRMLEFFFEDLKVPAFFVCSQPLLALYASGKTTGLVVDSGEDRTYAVVVYEGEDIIEIY